MRLMKQHRNQALCCECNGGMERSKPKKQCARLKLSHDVTARYGVEGAKGGIAPADGAGTTFGVAMIGRTRIDTAAIAQRTLHKRSYCVSFGTCKGEWEGHGVG
jgi:hypothetical protein